MKNENLVPKVRFKGFSDPWEQRKLGELSNGFTYGLNASAKAYDGKHQYLRITDIDDETRTFKQTHLTSPDIDFIRDNSYVLKLGDIVFTRTGASTGKTFIYRTADSIVYYAGFLIKMSVREDIDSEFVFQNTLTTSFNRFVKVMSQRSGQPGINSKEYARFKLYIPKLKEQVLVGNMLLLIDNLIAANEDKLEQLKTLKKLMMQKIFSQEWRFKGFTDPWEQRKLGELFNERKEKSSQGELLSVTINSGIVKFDTLDRKNNSSADKSNYRVVRYGDIAYNSMRMWQGASGLSMYNGIVSPAYTVITPRTNTDAGFMAVNFKRKSMIQVFQRNSQGLTSDTWNLKFPVLKNIRISIPKITEQQIITELFTVINNLIAANEDKLNQLKELKKYLMQNMFV
ncbi:restriction endonuclease subunit S [Lactiplantibacillus argentoratensis]|uniref:restriction endonuclease subunit S n=1 Tax=Lactiplantibacillus argentoratensis TaxID=271881 RepID=UPI0030D4E718